MITRRKKTKDIPSIKKLGKINSTDVWGFVCLSDNEEIIGYISYEFDNTTYFLYDFVVSHDFCKKKVGKELLDNIISKLTKRKRENIIISVPEYDLSSQQALRHIGFKASAIMHKEKTYLMEYKI